MATDLAQKDKQHDLLEILTWNDHRMDLAIPDGVLPTFLIEARGIEEACSPQRTRSRCMPSRSNLPSGRL